MLLLLNRQRGGANPGFTDGDPRTGWRPSEPGPGRWQPRLCRGGHQIDAL